MTDPISDAPSSLGSSSKPLIFESYSGLNVGLIDGLIVGLIVGLIDGLIVGLIDDSDTGLITGSKPCKTWFTYSWKELTFISIKLETKVLKSVDASSRTVFLKLSQVLMEFLMM